MAIEKKFVQDGYVKASMNEYFAKQLSRAGYGGMDLNRTPMGTQITIYAEKPGMVIGKAGKVIRRLTRDVDRLYNLDNPQIDAQEVKNPALNAQIMASRLASSIERGWYFRKAGHNAIRAIMSAGALGCEIVISGKLTGSRSRVEKIVDGYIKHAGKPVDDIVNEGSATAVKKLGTIGCVVRIIPPGAVLPDDYNLIDVPVEPEQKQEPVAEKAPGIEEMVEEEVPGETVSEEEAVTVKEETVDPEEPVESLEEDNTEETSEESGPEEEPQDEKLPEEERRYSDGTWQHKHEGHKYWHPMARIHRED